MIQKRVRSPRKTVHFNARLPQNVSEELRRFAERRRISTSAAAAQLLDEALRMEKFPGVSFRFTASGRQPFVTGTGMMVWELYHVWLDHKRDVRHVLKSYSHLKASQVNVAVAYAKEFPREEPPGFWGQKPSGATEIRV
ncbi:MAG TPA: hypothetical protein VMU54_11825 [Planctomycetota bacterium]|jgi:uncharacterized protein (DUF433 family)|nr:hypothetical protein [Planctomycetota bacterium]